MFMLYKKEVKYIKKTYKNCLKRNNIKCDNIVIKNNHSFSFSFVYFILTNVFLYTQNIQTWCTNV